MVGGIVNHDFSDEGIILTTGYDSAWNDKGAVYMLNILDPVTGTLRFSKPVKLEGRILATEVLPKGILFITTSEINILDPRTGRLVSKKSVASKHSLITATKGDHVFAFSRDAGELYRVDKRKATITKISKEHVKLRGKETPALLEVRGDGFVVASQQNLVSYAPDGSKKFHVYYPAPQRSGFMRALLHAQAIRAGMASFASGATGGAFAHAASKQDNGSVNQTISAGAARGYGEMSEDYASLSRKYHRAATQRFKASAMARDFMFMMVKLRRGDIGLAKVSKKTGSIVGMINLERDRTPSYQVDTISNRIYYRLSSSEVVGYRF